MVAIPVESGPEVAAAPMSFAQRRLWLLDRLSPDTPAYNVRHALRLRGQLDTAALQRTIDAIVARHEILRTHFGLQGDEPMQLIAASAAVPIRFVDLRTLPEAEREALARTIVEADADLGFDLERGPLVRVLLVRLHADESVLLTVMHHIVTDDWSTGVFHRELRIFYEAFSSGRTVQLDELPVQYADYAAWQREALQGEPFEQQVEYWREQLRDAPPRIELPTDRPRRALTGTEGASRSLLVSETIARGLRELGTAHGATLSMTMLAAFKALLYRYCGQTDLIVGLPIASRTRVELESLIGFFVNTLAVRTQLCGETGFETLLDDVRRASLGAYENGDVPFETVISEVHPERATAETPLVNVLFHLQTRREPTLRLGPLALEPFPVAVTTSKFDLILRAAETPDGLRCTLSYRPDLFDGDRIERMLAHFRTMLEGIVAAPATSLDALPLLSAAERHRALVEWNRTSTDYRSERTLTDGFEAQATRTPGNVAVADGVHELSYADLNRRANQLAHHLGELGVAPGDLVAVCCERSLEMVLATLAVLKAGAAYLPLDPENPPERLSYLLSEAGAGVVLTQDRFAPQLARAAAKVCAIDRERARIEQHSADRLERRTGADDLAYVMYTSGSTGEPKAVCVPHRAVNRLVTNTNYIALEESDRMAAISNVAFDAATFEVWGALLHGARIEIISHEVVLAPADFARALRERRVSVMFVTAALLRHVSAQEPAAFAGLRTLIAGGDALDPAAVSAVLTHGPPQRFLNGYGPTEATTFACTYEVKAPTSASIPLGRPIANTEAYVLDRALGPVPVGVDGQLYLGGPGVARGYLNDSQLTARKFIPHPFEADPQARLYATGDVVRYAPDGTLEFIGRVDNQVKIRGFRVETGEIEAALRRHELVRDAAVVVQHAGSGDSRLVAYVVTDEASPHSARTWRQMLAAELPPYMLPTVKLVPSIPLGPSGKTDYRALRERCEPRERAPDSPRGLLNNPLHYQLLAIWEEILGVSPVGIHDDFFELGGHSLLAARAIDALSRAYGKPFPAAEFFREPTVEHVARFFVEGLQDDRSSPIVPVRTEGSRTPFFFLHGDLKGGGYYVRRLTEFMNREQPVYGVHPHGVNARDFPPTIEAMAGDYVRLIRELRPSGPYALGGFCSGALVAFEMARQLQADGEIVSDLVLFDSAGANASLSALSEWVARSLRLLRVPAEGRAAARARLARSFGRIRSWRRYARRVTSTPLSKSGTLVRLIAKKTQAAFERRPTDLERDWRRISADYIPRRYRGRIKVVLASADGELGPNAAKIGWRRVADAVVLYPTLGAHLTSITRHVERTAATLDAVLAEDGPPSNGMSLRGRS